MESSGPEVPVTYTLRLGDEADPTAVTVVTPAFRRAFDFVDAYLATGEGEVGESGRALAIIGGLGTGKSHLARSVIDRIRKRQEDAIVLRLDTPHTGFGFLFRNVLIEQFGKDRLHDLVIDYYAQVTAAKLPTGEGEDHLSASIRAGLLAGTVDPRKVIEHYHLAQATLVGELRRRLSHLPEHAPYATALALMVMDDLVDPVWEWLSGGPPGQELRDRGVTHQLATPADAYNTLAVLAFLAGRMDRRLVLVIDEFEKLLGAPGPWEQAALNSFDELVQVFIETRSLPVFCGMTDSLAKLPPGLLQRTRVLTPTPFGATEMAELLGKRGREVSASLAGGLVEMSDGNPREALSLYRRSEAIVAGRGGGGSVTTAVLREAVRQRSQVPAEQVTGAVRTLLEESGLDFRSSIVLTGGADPVDFWIPYGDGSAAIAVLVTRSLLRKGEEVYLRAQVDAAREAAVPCEVIVVVNGHLTARMRAEVSGLTGRQPLVFDLPGFGTAFRSAVDAAVRRLAAAADEGALDGLRRQMDRLSRQQTATQNMMDNLLESVAGLKTSAPGTGRPAPPLPARIAAQFDDAAADTDPSGDLGGILTELFDDPGNTEVSVRARRRLSSRELVEAAGTVWLQRQLLDAFRERLSAFLGGAGPGPLTSAQEEELLAMCRTFEVSVQALPPAPISAPVWRDPRSSARPARGRALDELGRRVLSEVRTGTRG
ncbi:hypothetical protein Sme01_56890 [Sphaerisporangium melleum]|uniref:Uncharacterized protein n=1 Tax=Sphaerisporangium melleum TaxID=321316 RepID=A0A917R7H8_9ACTN|nr:hypothetical protein [Sphaerisporangium melleum]GGK94181.1 hypothetical protein GCM10007964_40770 [Sphaerisporangium melleum]GII73213.1 hypothetical protein Sme01_56890 [Sphaerisporangium melleum]